MKKKPIYERAWFAFALVLIVRLTFGYFTAETPIEEPIATTSVAKTETSDFANQGLKNPANLAREDKIQIALGVMDTQFSGIGVADYDPKLDALVVLPTELGVQQDISDTYSGFIPRDAWNDLVRHTKSTSVSISSTVDTDLSVAILNPDNPKSVILLVQNGRILYDVMDDSRG